MKKHFSILVIVLSLLYGCNNTAEENTKDNKITITLKKTDEHSHNENTTIELNHGAKWKIVPEMMVYLKSMESDISRFDQSKQVAFQDYMQLGTNLQKNIDLLTSNCTMEGKAHDELHKWLLPYIDLVDRLNKSKTNDEAKTTYKEIKSSYTVFNLYFE